MAEEIEEKVGGIPKAPGAGIVTVGAEKPVTIVSATLADEAIETDEIDLEAIRTGLEEAEQKALAIKEEIAKGITPEVPAYDVDVARGGERIRISSTDLAKYQSQGWNVAPDIPDELLEEGEKVETEQDKQISQLQIQVADYHTQINDYIGTLDTYRASVSEASQNVISSIQRQYEVLRDEQREINRRAEATIRTIGIRLGVSRYSPLLATGMITAQENAGIQALAQLSAQESALIAKAEQARTDKDYELMHSQMELIRDERNRKNEILLDLQRTALEKSEESKNRMIQISREAGVIDLINQGWTDPAQIFGLINYDEGGNIIGDVTMEEINALLGDLPEEKKQETQTINSIPYRVVRDASGNVLRFEKVPGIEPIDMTKELTTTELKALNAAGANLPFGATREDAQKLGIVIGQIRTREELSAFERLAARNLSVQIFGKRAGTRAENIELIENLMAGGMNIDEITDNLRYEGVSTEFQGTFKDAFEFITKSGFSISDRTFAREYFDELLEEGEVADSIDYLLGLARDKGTTEERKAVGGRDDAMYALDDIERLLNEYKSKGGTTGLLEGNIEKFQENILKRTGDPELARLGNEMAIIIQRYRQQLTGAAFTESEAREYQRLFPGIEKSPELNQALIDSMRNAYNRYQEGYYKRTIGDSNYEALINMLYTGIIGQQQASGIDPLGIAGGGSEQTTNYDPLNINP